MQASGSPAAGGLLPGCRWTRENGELARFLICLIAALQAIGPDIGTRVLAALTSPQPSPAESVLTALLNEVAAIPDAFILVLLCPSDDSP